MPKFTVTWIIDIDDREDERGAATAACRIMRDLASDALVFNVREARHGCRNVVVDLSVDETAAEQLRLATRRKRKGV